MATHRQVVQAKAVRQKDDKPVQEHKTVKVTPPASWQLNEQQQAFIDLFSVDSQKKQ